MNNAAFLVTKEEKKYLRGRQGCAETLCTMADCGNLPVD